MISVKEDDDRVETISHSWRTWTLSQTPQLKDQMPLSVVHFVTSFFLTSFQLSWSSVFLRAKLQ